MSFAPAGSVVNRRLGAFEGSVADAVLLTALGKIVIASETRSARLHLAARITESDLQSSEHRSSFDQHNDTTERSAQAFPNYMLDKSVILDNQNNAHASAWNAEAEAL
jgi:hypothetical protein